MFGEIATRLISNRKVQFGLLLCFILLVVLFVVLFLVRDDNYRVVRLGISSSNRSTEFDGTYVRSFNGISFYKIPVDKTSAPVVLGGGVKLPVVTNAVWAGDAGVLLNFDQSLIHTAVEKIADQRGLSYQQERNSTWYFDFGSNQLYYVGNFTLYENVSSYNNGLLSYITGSVGKFELHTYNTKTRVDSSNPIPVSLDSVSNIGTCPSSNNICIVGHPAADPSRAAVYSVDADQNAHELLSIKGELYPIQDMNTYLTLDNSDNISGSGEDATLAYNKASLFDLTKRVRIAEIGKTFSPDGFLYTNTGDSLTLLSGAGNGYSSTKKILWFTAVIDNELRYIDGEDFTAAPVLSSKPSPNGILFPSSDGQLNLLARKDADWSNFSTKDSDSITEHLKTCAKNSDIKVQYNSTVHTMSILIPDNSQFDSSVKDISSCLTRDTNFVKGYDYSFTSYNVKTGSITSY